MRGQVESLVYRRSKLTQILKGSLNPVDARTIVIVCVSPSRSVLGSWVGARRLSHLSVLLTASRMVLPKILVLTLRALRLVPVGTLLYGKRGY